MTEQEYQQSVVTDYLRRLCDGQSRPAFRPYDALLSYGGLMNVVRERPRHIKPGAPKQFYANSIFGLVAQGKNNPDELFYCEGFAIEAGGLGCRSSMHGWLTLMGGSWTPPGMTHKGMCTSA